MSPEVLPWSFLTITIIFIIALRDSERSSLKVSKLEWGKVERDVQCTLYKYCIKHCIKQCSNKSLCTVLLIMQGLPLCCSAAWELPGGSWNAHVLPDSLLEDWVWEIWPASTWLTHALVETNHAHVSRAQQICVFALVPYCNFSLKRWRLEENLCLEESQTFSRFQIQPI